MGSWMAKAATMEVAAAIRTTVAPFLSCSRMYSDTSLQAMQSCKPHYGKQGRQLYNVAQLPAPCWMHQLSIPICFWGKAPFCTAFCRNYPEPPICTVCLIPLLHPCICDHVTLICTLAACREVKECAHAGNCRPSSAISCRLPTSTLTSEVVPLTSPSPLRPGLGPKAWLLGTQQRTPLPGRMSESSTTCRTQALSVFQSGGGTWPEQKPNLAISALHLSSACHGMTPVNSLGLPLQYSASVWGRAVDACMTSATYHASRYTD